MRDLVFTLPGSYEDSGGVVREVEAGERYRVADSVATKIVRGETAYPAGQPPACRICGLVFEGATAYRHKDLHEVTEHPETIEDLSDSKARELLVRAGIGDDSDDPHARLRSYAEGR